MKACATSAAGDRVDVAHALGQAILCQLTPAILGAEHLAEGDTRRPDRRRVGALRRPSSSPRLDPMVEALPRRTNIVAPIDRPVVAARRRAEAGVNNLSVMSRDADVAARQSAARSGRLDVEQGFAPFSL